MSLHQLQDMYSPYALTSRSFLFTMEYFRRNRNPSGEGNDLPVPKTGTVAFRYNPALLYNPRMGGLIKPGNREKNHKEFSREWPGNAGT